MYHGVTPRNMWEAEPTLYWRVKRNGKWRYERANFVRMCDINVNEYWIELPRPPGGE